MESSKKRDPKKTGYRNSGNHLILCYIVSSAYKQITDWNTGCCILSGSWGCSKEFE